MFKLVNVAVDTLLILMPAWAALLNVGPSILFSVPLPLSGLVKFMFDKERLLVEVKTPPCTVFWIVPPLPAVVPVPVTVRPPLEPVVSRTMPLVAPLALMSWNVRPLAPIEVLVTLSAVPVVVTMLLAALAALTVPPLLALKP